MILSLRLTTSIPASNDSDMIGEILEKRDRSAGSDGYSDTNTKPMADGSSSDSHTDDTADDGHARFETEEAAREAGLCGATNRDDEPCHLPAGWGTPGSGGDRCRHHGGASTGPSDTSHLAGNDYAEGNPGGGAPEGNANAEIHGGFADWWKAYERFDEDTREWVDGLAADMRKKAAEHAPDIPAERRAELCLEKATLMLLELRVSADVWCSPDGSGPGRGLIVEREAEIDGETVTIRDTNPALRAETALSRRQREIAEELSLWPGFQDDVTEAQ